MEYIIIVVHDLLYHQCQVEKSLRRILVGQILYRPTLLILSWHPVNSSIRYMDVSPIQLYAHGSNDYETELYFHI